LSSTPRSTMGAPPSLPEKNSSVLEHAARLVERSVVAEVAKRESERLADARVIERGQRQRAVAFAELRTVRTEDEREMDVLGRGIAERLLQRDLARRGSEQVGAAHDLRYALLGIVDDDGELIGEEAVGAADDEVVAVRCAEADRARGASGRQSV